jgi:hypothetical protein
MASRLPSCWSCYCSSRRFTRLVTLLCIALLLVSGASAASTRCVSRVRFVQSWSHPLPAAAAASVLPALVLATKASHMCPVIWEPYELRRSGSLAGRTDTHATATRASLAGTSERCWSAHCEAISKHHKLLLDVIVESDLVDSSGVRACAHASSLRPVRSCTHIVLCLFLRFKHTRSQRHANL